LINKFRFKNGFSIIVIVLLSLEAGSRFFWKAKFNVPLFETDKIIFVFYPELINLQKGETRGQSKPFKILILGASVVASGWSPVEDILKNRLESVTGRNVRIFNVAQKSHTSLDSLIKYTLIKNVHFDWVLFYHGINEARVNNCPISVFREDYSHMAWYRYLHSLKKYSKWIKYVSFPYTLEYAFLTSLSAVGPSNLIDKENPIEEWLHFGSKVKSKETFKKNLNEIINIANERKQSLLLMSFAHYIPANYSSENFKNKLLDYSGHLLPIRVWGTKENVQKTIEEHNKIVRLLADEGNQNIHFLDQAVLIPKSGKSFKDICHMTHLGSEQFVKNIINIITEKTPH